jgi:hypothetical protein
MEVSVLCALILNCSFLKLSSCKERSEAALRETRESIKPIHDISYPDLPPGCRRSALKQPKTKYVYTHRYPKETIHYTISIIITT